MRLSSRRPFVTPPPPKKVYYYLDRVLMIQVERRARIHKLRLEKGAEKAAEELKKCNATFLLLLKLNDS